jgi:hypothetical protein
MAKNTQEPSISKIPGIKNPRNQTSQKSRISNITRIKNIKNPRNQEYQTSQESRILKIHFPRFSAQLFW